MLGVVAASAALVAGACGGSDADYAPGAPYAVSVVSFEAGEQAGHGQDRLPDVVLGPPRGAGEAMGSTDVLSLGVDGVIVLELGVEVVDRDGPDLVVFENPFRVGGTGPLFAEPGHVGIGQDAESFVEWPCAPEEDGSPGCAGVSPVFANADTNDIDPTDPADLAAAGGDAFDLADVGVERARFVRIRDSGVDRGFGEPTGGFDLDAIAVISRAP